MPFAVMIYLISASIHSSALLPRPLAFILPSALPYLLSPPLRGGGWQAITTILGYLPKKEWL
jgi:hypothetical protein